MPGEEITTITNNHIEGCGEPPNIDFSEYGYVSYFENQYGEQAFILYDDDAEQLEFYMGDAGWEESYTTLTAEEVAEMDPNYAPLHLGTILGNEEGAWVIGAIEAVKARV